MSALVVKELNCSYQDNKILKDLSLELNSNEIVCLLGESGCGKTTLLRAVAGLQAELSGEIEINGVVVDSATVHCAPEKRKVGLIFQDYALFPHLSVFDNVAFSLSKEPKKEIKKRVEAVLSLVQLSDYASRFPHQLSGGQQQRIAIARALAYQPDLMLLDEPFSNLDQHVRFQLIKEIRKLLKSCAMSALFVTHSKEEGFAFADKIALMQTGKIVQIGVPQTLYNAPKSRYVADFMGQANYIDAKVIAPNSFQTALGMIKVEEYIEQSPSALMQLLLRPEQIALSVEKDGLAIITDIDFLGAFQLFTVNLEGVDFLVKQNNQHITYNVGDKVTLSIIQHDFVLFPKD